MFYLYTNRPKKKKTRNLNAVNKEKIKWFSKRHKCPGTAAVHMCSIFLKKILNHLKIVLY